MNHWLFLYRINDKRVLQAIAQAESRTSGEIRVFVSHKKVTDPLAEAQEQFSRLGMTETRHRNAVLIYIAPRTRNFALWGDEAVHEKCGDIFWSEVAQSMSAAFHKGQLTEALVEGIRRSGELLAENFPPADEPRNELPDRIERE
jgi:uncharacterized membrane protein